MYSIEGLKRGIENCQKNIQIFKDAIRQEEQKIKQYQFYMQEILRKEKEQKEMTKHIIVEVSEDGN